MTLEFCRTESDYRAARFSWLLHHPWKAFEEFPDQVAGIAACLLVSVLAFADREVDWRMAFRSVVFGALIAAAGYAWFLWRSHAQFRRKFSANASVTAGIDERGITLTGGANHRPFLWVGFTRIYESGRVIVMETGGDDFIFLPKRAMSEAQLAELRRFAIAGTRDCPVAITPPLA